MSERKEMKISRCKLLSHLQKCWRKNGEWKQTRNIYNTQIINISTTIAKKRQRGKERKIKQVPNTNSLFLPPTAPVLLHGFKSPLCWNADPGLVGIRVLQFQRCCFFLHGLLKLMFFTSALTWRNLWHLGCDLLLLCVALCQSHTATNHAVVFL